MPKCVCSRPQKTGSSRNNPVRTAGSNSPPRSIVQQQASGRKAGNPGSIAEASWKRGSQGWAPPGQTVYVVEPF